MRRLAFALSLAVVSAAQAGAIIKITSSDAARVSVDGEDLGVTPITLRDMKPGKYQIQLENVRTGMLQTYSVHSPKAGTVEREVHAQWARDEAAAPAPIAPVIAQPVALQPVSAQPVIASPVIAQPAPVAVEEPALAAPPAVAPEGRTKEEAERSRVRARNTVLGAAVANELLNKGKSKKSLRKVAGGIGLLNEALNR